MSVASALVCVSCEAPAVTLRACPTCGSLVGYGQRQHARELQRMRAAEHRQLLARAFALGRAIEQMRQIRQHLRPDDMEQERSDRLAALAAGQSRGHLTRLALDVLPPAGYEVGT